MIFEKVISCGTLAYMPGRLLRLPGHKFLLKIQCNPLKVDHIDAKTCKNNYKDIFY